MPRWFTSVYVCDVAVDADGDGDGRPTVNAKVNVAPLPVLKLMWKG
jgi:hypothetical protein